jgi:hypothetical protein
MNEAIFYDQGMTWDEYFYTMRKYQRLMARNIAFCRLPPADRALWEEADHIAHVLVFTEDYCADSLNAIPPLLAIAQVAPFDLRVLRRDEDIERMMEITGDAQPRVPTFLFYDADWNEVGRFVERPEAVNRLDELDEATVMMLRQSRSAFTEWVWEQVFEELRPIARKQA